ncbi:MAG: fibronectin type III domain-containing protein [Deltaproteobacteria bacterium]|nr:fibronectin type III domain-containing protein [Deltaproteobacteria bacterium]
MAIGISVLACVPAGQPSARGPDATPGDGAQMVEDAASSDVLLGSDAEGALPDALDRGDASSIEGDAGVTDTGVGPGEAFLSWDPPAQNVDGSPLRDLAGYRVWHGTAPATYEATLDVGLTTSYRVRGLSSGRRYYFAVSAYDTSGNEGPLSVEVFKEVP